jgi:hypothetical protein
VLVLRPQPVGPDPDDAGIQVDIGPVKTQHLALSEAERQSDSPACCVSALGGRLENEPDLLDGVRLDVFLLDPRRPRQGGRVLSDLPAA